MRFFPPVLCLTMLAAGAVGQTAGPAPKVLTLQQVKDIALERNLSVVQAQNNEVAASGQVTAAWGDYLPSVSASGGWNRTQNENEGYTTFVQGIPVTAAASSKTVGNFNAGLSAGLLVFDFLGRESNLSATRARANAAAYTVARTRQGIVYQSVSEYLNVLRSEQLVKVADENLRRDRRQLDRITESNRVGALSLADVYRQQSQVANDELSVISATNTYEKAKADLLALIGVDATADYVFQDPSIPSEIDSAEVAALRASYRGLGPLNERALSARPDYLGARENYDAAAAGVTTSRSTYFPTISAFGSYSMANEELQYIRSNRNLSWGLSLRWNLFDGFLRESQVQSAVVSRRNAEISLQQAERNVAVDIRKALLDLDAAAKALDVTKQAVVSATEDRKIAEERYNLGAGTLLDLLVASANYVNAQANKVNAVYGYLTARYNLEFVLGERQY